MEERNYRKSIKHLKKLPLYWLWMPIVYCLLLSFGCIAIINILPKGLESVFVFLVFLAFYTLALIPVMSISYCKRICKMRWKKYLCCIYNAFVTGLCIAPCLVVEMINKGQIETTSYLFEIIIEYIRSPFFLCSFILALICGLLTLLRYDEKNRKTKDNSPS